jgi:phage terminase small subunit
MPMFSAKQQRFIAEYLVDANGSAAAVRAGYGRAGARVAAHRLLTNANVARVLQARQREDAHRLRVAREDAIAGLLNAIDTAKVQASPMAQIAGWREVAKMLGFYAPHRERASCPHGSAELLEDLESMSDQRLLAIATS